MLTYTAWTGYQDASFSIPLTSFPATISLTKGASAVVYVSTAIAAAPQSGVIFGQPLLQVLYGSGSPLQTPGAGTAAFNLQGGRSYGNLSLSGSVRAYSAGPSPQQIVSFSVWAILFGHSAS